MWLITMAVWAVVLAVTFEFARVFKHYDYRSFLLEFLGPILLLAGLATRPVAVGLGALMVGAIATVHLQHGFFMNWSGTQSGEGFEYHLLVLGLSVALALQGGGRWSLDRRLAGGRR